MILIRKCLLAILLFFNIYSVWSQKTTINRDSVHTTISAKYNYGFVIPHNTSISYLIEDYTQGLEVSYAKTNYTQDNWSAYFNYPDVGVGFYYSSLGNDEVYGNGYALFPYVNFHIYRQKRFNLNYKVALGLGYVDKIFDLYTNKTNLVTSSSFNAYVGAALNASYRFTESLSLTASLSLNHFSNGAAKRPNQGINNGSVGVGLQYHFNELLVPDVNKVKAPAINRQEFVSVISFGQNQVHRSNDKRYWSSTLNLQWLWHTSEKRAWGTGVDIMYNAGAPQLFLDHEDDLMDYSEIDKVYGGIFGSYNLILNRVTMVMQLGVYVWYKIKPIQAIYPRLGVRYNITDRILANFSVKASFCSSEYLELGLGYRFLK